MDNRTCQDVSSPFVDADLDASPFFAAWNANGDTVALAYSSGIVVLCPETMEQWSVERHDGITAALSFSEDGSELF